MTELTLKALRAELNRSVTVLQQDVRALCAAFNDFARGEIEALHNDVNAVQARNAELEIELATLRRVIEELSEKIEAKHS